MTVSTIRKPEWIDVVGVTFVAHYPLNFQRLAEHMKTHTAGESIAVVLIRNPLNKFDSNAIEVHLPALTTMAMVGHVPKSTAARIAPLMDAGHRYTAEVVQVRIAYEDLNVDRPGLTIAITNHGQLAS